MIELVADLWDIEADARVITTNPIINQKGLLVMGRGCAKEAATKLPGLALYLGHKVKNDGNHVWYLNEAMVSKLAGSAQSWALFTFPVKHHWRDAADLELIMRSTVELSDYVDRLGYERVVVPRPGCGNGRLSWSSVRPILSALDDRFLVVTKR